jgi:hypothetical protein
VRDPIREVSPSGFDVNVLYSPVKAGRAYVDSFISLLDGIKGLKKVPHGPGQDAKTAELKKKGFVVLLVHDGDTSLLLDASRDVHGPLTNRDLLHRLVAIAERALNPSTTPTT